MFLIALKVIGTAAIAAFSGWAWRFGGSHNGIRWVREAGIGAGLIGFLTIWLGWSYWYIPIMGLAFIESTYFKIKGQENASWKSWLLCGILYSLIPLPAVIVHKLWIGFAIRTVVLTPIITLWRTFQGDVQWSEAGAGVWQIITLPLLLITWDMVKHLFIH